MVRAEEIRKGQDQLHFALATLGRPKLQHRESAKRREPVVVAQAIANPYEVNLNGVRVLMGLALAIGLGSLFLWEFVRRWLFAP
jgi:hypothetical protein